MIKSKLLHSSMKCTPFFSLFFCRRSSHFYLPTSEQVHPKQRSHSVVNVYNPNDDSDIFEEVEFVGVRDEIILIKRQFDKILAVFFNLPNNNGDTISLANKT